MGRMKRLDRCGAIWTERGDSISDWRRIGTVTSLPTIGKSAYGKYTAFDGTDDKIAVSGVNLAIKSVVMHVYLATTTEQIVDFDGGTSYIHANAGTLTATGFTAPTLYVDGVVTSTITMGWHHIAVTTGTSVPSTAIQFGTDNVNFGNVYIANISLWNRALSATEVSQLYYGTAFDYEKAEKAHWTQSNVNDADISFAGNAYNMTGTGIVASTDIIGGPYGGKATQYNGTDERASAGDVGNIRTVSLMVNPDTTTEELVYLDTGKDVMVSGGTVTYTGVTADATYVNGVETTALEAGKWQHLVCVFNANVDANLFGLAYDGTNFGAATLGDCRIYTLPLTNLQVSDLWATIKQGVA